MSMRAVSHVARRAMERNSDAYRGRYDAADVHIVRHMLGKRTVNSWKYGAPASASLTKPSFDSKGRLACAAMESIVVRADIPTHFF
jgi:hypothetical protein